MQTENSTQDHKSASVQPLRLDRLATLYIADPLRRLVGGENQQRLPILMYHSICENRSNNVHPYYVTETSPETFEAHMKYLHEEGYSSISPEELLNVLNSSRPNRQKLVVITFDDGYRNFYTRAFPILSKYNMRATVYLPTAYINNQAQSFLGKKCLTWTQARELQDGGIFFGSHTVTHSRLRHMASADLERELRESKDTIENELGTAVTSFAYPFAFPEEDRIFTHTLQVLLEKNGYQNGVSTIIGSVHSNSDKFFLKRLPASSCDDLTFFRAKLAGSYDWLHALQFLTKRARFQKNRCSVC
jgi:peptidoglycan/xylan/chitin deacetylase (PgdA/CDA1 family)